MAFTGKTLPPLDDGLGHAEGNLIMFLAKDRVSKFICVEFHGKAGKMAGSAFFRNVVRGIPEPTS